MSSFEQCQKLLLNTVHWAVTNRSMRSVAKPHASDCGTVLCMHTAVILPMLLRVVC